MKVVFVVVLALFSNRAFAQIKADMSQLAFFAGEWRGKMDWGDLEEYWSEPMGNSMMCSFRCIREGKPVFYEFVVIEQKAGVPTMMLRHFNPGNIAWEDKDKPYEYALVELTKTKCVFESADKKTRLTYERESDTLHVILEREKESEKVSDRFVYQLVN